MKRTVCFILSCLLLLSVCKGLPVRAQEALLSVYVQYGTQTECIAAYSASELAELAETSEEGYGYYFYKNGNTNAVAVTEYVALSALLSDAGTDFSEGDCLKLFVGDGEYTKGNFSYEELSVRGVDENGEPVPTALACTWSSGTIENEASFAALKASATNTGSLRFVSGMTEAERADKSAAGSRMPSGVSAITVVKPENKPFISFEDVAKDSYYYDAVYWAAENNITAGTGAGKFSPDKTCTRAEMVSFLWRAAGSPAPKTADTAFTDLIKGSYYYNAVLWAVEEGITMGTSGTSFSPNKTVSRSEAVSFLFRMAKAEKPTEASDFQDVPAGAFYADAVAWACANKITFGTSKTSFSPLAPCLRAQTVAFLYRYFYEV